MSHVPTRAMVRPDTGAVSFPVPSSGPLSPPVAFLPATGRISTVIDSRSLVRVFHSVSSPLKNGEISNAVKIFNIFHSSNDLGFSTFLRESSTSKSSKREKLCMHCHVTRGSIEEEVKEVKQEDSVPSMKAALYRELEGVNRGIFGVQSAKKAQIEGLIKELEAVNPLQEPTKHLNQVEGAWRLLYSTISILGPRRTKLGLREFVNLGEFRQIIDTTQSRAVTEVQFNVAGMKAMGGWFTLEASYSVLTGQRVGIKFESSKIVPPQLMTLFEKNYDLLLSIFNPEGWLDITYVDESIRIGRDDKGNIFLVERIKIK